MFNVAITRARSEQQVFISFDPRNLKKTSLLSQFLEDVQSDRFTIPGEQVDHLDAFATEVLGHLEKMGFSEIYSPYPIAGTQIDIVLVRNGTTYCIDLIGYPGAFEEALPIERWRMLERVGISTFSLDYSSWVLDRETCIKALSDFLEF